jgi:hypothetical protein
VSNKEVICSLGNGLDIFGENQLFDSRSLKMLMILDKKNTGLPSLGVEPMYFFEENI